MDFSHPIMLRISIHYCYQTTTSWGTTVHGLKFLFCWISSARVGLYRTNLCKGGEWWVDNMRLIVNCIPRIVWCNKYTSSIATVMTQQIHWGTAREWCHTDDVTSVTVETELNWMFQRMNGRDRMLGELSTLQLRQLKGWMPIVPAVLLDATNSSLCG